MKRVLSISLFVTFLVFGTAIFSQTFSGKGSKQFQIGIGLTQHDGWYPTNGTGPKGHVKPIAGIVHLQFELGIHKYIGVGMHLGGEFAKNLNRTSVGLLLPSTSYSSFYSIGIPIGIHANFHFFQLIADKSGKEKMGEKLDVYAGLSFGSGPAFAIPKSGYKSFGSDLGYMLYGGPHAGIRFYPKEKLGYYAEIGYGKSYINVGIVFKF